MIIRLYNILYQDDDVGSPWWGSLIYISPSRHKRNAIMLRVSRPWRWELSHRLANEEWRGVNNNKIFKVAGLAGITSHFPALGSFAPEITGGQARSPSSYYSDAAADATTKVSHLNYIIIVIITFYIIIINITF